MCKDCPNFDGCNVHACERMRIELPVMARRRGRNRPRQYAMGQPAQPQLGAFRPAPKQAAPLD